MGNYGPAHEILVLISLASRRSLDEPAHIGSLARSFASHIDKNGSSGSLCQKFTSSTSGYVSINLQAFYVYSKTSPVLSHLCRMEFSTVINLTCPFPF